MPPCDPSASQRPGRADQSPAALGGHMGEALGVQRVRSEGRCPQGGTAMLGSCGDGRQCTGVGPRGEYVNPRVSPLLQGLWPQGPQPRGTLLREICAPAGSRWGWSLGGFPGCEPGVGVGQGVPAHQVENCLHGVGLVLRLRGSGSCPGPPEGSKAARVMIMGYPLPCAPISEAAASGLKPE